MRWFVGKHGNLEWLPGKVRSVEPVIQKLRLVLCSICTVYCCDPGEGSQAKRRAQAVILDHLTPPMTRAELYGPCNNLRV